MDGLNQSGIEDCSNENAAESFKVTAGNISSYFFKILVSYAILQHVRGETAMSTVNRKYKDSVFVDLFSEDEKAKENFLSLYNALHGTNLPLSCPVENIRLDNVMYMNIVNDVSCLIDNKIIVLAEHQSTINENIPSQRLYVLVQSLLAR